MINIAVCDDEKCMCEKIEKMTQDFFRKKNTDISVVKYSSGEEMLKSNEREKVEELEKKLSQIEVELSKKDNDTYRRHSAVPEVPSV